jgi:hypothetical protein
MCVSVLLILPCEISLSSKAYSVCLSTIKWYEIHSSPLHGHNSLKEPIWHHTALFEWGVSRRSYFKLLLVAETFLIQFSKQNKSTFFRSTTIITMPGVIPLKYPTSSLLALLPHYKIKLIYTLANLDFFFVNLLKLFHPLWNLKDNHNNSVVNCNNLPLPSSSCSCFIFPCTWL